MAQQHRVHGEPHDEPRHQRLAGDRHTGPILDEHRRGRQQCRAQHAAGEPDTHTFAKPGHAADPRGHRRGAGEPPDDPRNLDAGKKGCHAREPEDDKQIHPVEAGRHHRRRRRRQCRRHAPAKPAQKVDEQPHALSSAGVARGRCGPRLTACGCRR